METILKPHNQVELPKEVCRRLELMPGVRLSVEIDGANGSIILIPLSKIRQLHKSSTMSRSSSSMKYHK